MPEKPLHVVQKTVNIVSWETYAHDRENNRQGLDEFLAEVYGLEKKEGQHTPAFELLEVGNDTEYLYEVEPTDMSAASYDRKYYEKILEHGCLEEYHLRDLLCDACFRGFIKAGTWLVKVSW